MTTNPTGAWSRRHVSLALLASVWGGGALLNSIGATAAQEADLKFKTVTSDDLEQMLRKKDFLFLNVHIPYEGEIAPTDAFIPFDRIGDNLAVLPADKTAAIFLYCRSGRMSKIAATTLADLGYTGVSQLEGGMIAWEAAGYALVRDPSKLSS